MQGEWLPQPAAEDIRLVRVLHALGDPVRLQLLSVYLRGQEFDCDLSGLGLDHLHKSTVSHHMKVLREAGVTSTRVSGRNRFVKLRRVDLDKRFPGLLDALLRGLEGEAS
ncbi:ArsR/SmtB family transcription factor [Streptomyces roseifaciens]|uniref:ArsR/SmtB family transcription factor n=1 Tax=Streptomyces roseifaciens TaxID=1488406 RepID=UPI0007182E43|nr:ArsR family transcriptional regulator [Streptomyces roseifaciens]